MKMVKIMILGLCVSTLSGCAAVDMTGSLARDIICPWPFVC